MIKIQKTKGQGKSQWVEPQFIAWKTHKLPYQLPYPRTVTFRAKHRPNFKAGTILAIQAGENPGDFPSRLRVDEEGWRSSFWSFLHIGLDQKCRLTSQKMLGLFPHEQWTEPVTVGDTYLHCDGFYGDKMGRLTVSQCFSDAVPSMSSYFLVFHGLFVWQTHVQLM